MNISRYLEINQVKTNGKQFNSPYYDEGTIEETFSLNDSYSYEGIKYLTYESSGDDYFSIEIDMDLDRVQSCIFTDEDGNSRSIEIIEINDLQKMEF